MRCPLSNLAGGIVVSLKSKSYADFFRCSLGAAIELLTGHPALANNGLENIFAYFFHAPVNGHEPFPTLPLTKIMSVISMTAYPGKTSRFKDFDYFCWGE
jgi:hypothetical protein